MGSFILFCRAGHFPILYHAVRGLAGVAVDMMLQTPLSHMAPLWPRAEPFSLSRDPNLVERILLLGS